MAGTAGIGVRLREVFAQDGKSREVQISQMWPQGPAKKGGMLHEGDTITKIAGKSVKGLSSIEADRLLIGQPRSRVRVQVRRGTATFDCTLMREEINKSEPTKVIKKPESFPKKGEPHKLTPMEQARKLTDGTGGRGVFKHSRREDLGTATDEEAERIRAENDREKEEAQEIADREYEEERKRHEEELKQRNKEGMKQLWNLIWYGDEKGPPPKKKEKKTPWHKKTAADIKQWYKRTKNDTIVHISVSLPFLRFRRRACCCLPRTTAARSCSTLALQPNALRRWSMRRWSGSCAGMLTKRWQAGVSEVYVQYKVDKEIKKWTGQEKRGFWGQKKKQQQGCCAPCASSRK